MPGLFTNGTRSRNRASKPSVDAELCFLLQPGRIRVVGRVELEVKVRVIHSKSQSICPASTIELICQSAARPASQAACACVAAEVLLEVAQREIGDEGEVRGGVPGVDRCEPAPIDEGDGLAGLFQQIRRGDAGDAPSDDRHIHRHIPIQCGKAGKRFGVHPVRCRVECAHISLMCCSRFAVRPDTC